MKVQAKENNGQRACAGDIKPSPVCRIAGVSSEHACGSPFHKGAPCVSVLWQQPQVGTNECGNMEMDSERQKDIEIGHGEHKVTFRMKNKTESDDIILSVLDDTPVINVMKLVAEKLQVDTSTFAITSDDGTGLSPQQTARSVFMKQGGNLRIIQRDRVGTEDMDTGNTTAAAASDNSRRKKVELYDAHKFNQDLGFTTNKEMFAMCVSDTPIEADTPRHLVILDKGETKFSKHPRRMLILAMRKFLNINKEEMTPVIGVWTDEKGTVINVETKCDEHSKKLMNANDIFGVEVKVIPHKFRNFSRVTVWDNEAIFAPFSDAELRAMLADQAVVEVKRDEYMDKNTKIKKLGKRYRITYNKKVPPSAIKFPQLGIQMRTELFVPKPARCFKCQRFGHYEDRCNSREKVCYRCAAIHRTIDGKCLAITKCVNCHGDHPSSFMGCPAYKQECSVKRSSVEDRISPREVMTKLKERGLYIDYTRSSAQAVVAPSRDHPSRPNNDRLQSVENSIKEVKEMIVALGNGSDNNASSEPVEVQMRTARSVEMEDITEENRRLVNENRQLMEDMKEFGKFRDEFNQMKQEMNKLREKESQTDQNDEEVRGEIEKLKRELATVKEENKLLVSDTKTENSEKLKDQVVELTQIKSSLELKVNSKDAEILHLKTNIDKYSPTTRTKELEAEVIALKKGISSASSTAKRKWDELQAEKQKLLKEKDDKIGKLNDDLSRLKKSTVSIKERHHRSRSLQKGGFDSSCPSSIDTG